MWKILCQGQVTSFSSTILQSLSLRWKFASTFLKLINFFSLEYVIKEVDAFRMDFNQFLVCLIEYLFLFVSFPLKEKKKTSNNSNKQEKKTPISKQQQQKAFFFSAQFRKTDNV